jgi:hypothetical protein
MLEPYHRIGTASVPDQRHDSIENGLTAMPFRPLTAGLRGERLATAARFANPVVEMRAKNGGAAIAATLASGADLTFATALPRTREANVKSKSSTKAYNSEWSFDSNAA